MIFNHYIDPVLFSIGPLSIRYYGLFVVIAIILALFTWRQVLKKDIQKFETLFDLLVWLIIGGTIGARLGHVFFYEWEYYSQRLVEIFFIQNGGLASHGLTIGFVVSFFLFIKIRTLKISDYIDLVALGIPFIIIFVRLANFLNSEIVGRTTGGEWGVAFHLFEREAVLRHPTQLYEAVLGFMILILGFWSYKYFYVQKKIPYLAANIFVFTYFSSRFFIEFLKEYQTLDSNSFLTMGQYLSIVPVCASLYFFWHIYTRKAS